MTLSADIFKSAMARFASGVTVVTSEHSDGTLRGITVSAFISVSLQPPLILVSIDKRSGAHDALMQLPRYGVSILAESQQAVSDFFAKRPVDLEPSYHYLAEVPVLDGALAQLACETRQRVDAGDHTLFIAEVLEAEIHDGNPLLYALGNYGKLSR